MDITSYLEELLLQSKEVGIAGLGTFYKKKFSGRYDKEQQAFLPPSYVLQFSKEVRNEQALTDFISGKRNISHESANHYINKFVEEKNLSLASEHEALISNIGRLFFTETEDLTFEPSNNIHYGSEFFGLPILPEIQYEQSNIRLEDDSKVEKNTISEEIKEDQSLSNNNAAQNEPTIETVELDEVKDDLRITLGQNDLSSKNLTDAPDFIKQHHEEHPNRFGHQPENEQENKQVNHESDAESGLELPVSDAPDFIKQQHEEHPKRFGHQPENEQENKEVNHESDAESGLELPVSDAPDFIKQQHEEHPKRFGHQPENEQVTDSADGNVEGSANRELPGSDAREFVEQQHEENTGVFLHQPEREQKIAKTYVNLEDDKVDELPITQAPEFIQDQHAEHPNRFGNDPLLDEVVTERKSVWGKLLVAILTLITLVGLAYFLKPEIFNKKIQEKQKIIVPADTVVRTQERTRYQKDSIARTDSILKAIDIRKTEDSTQAKIISNTPPNPPQVTFDVIGASYKTLAGAEKYVRQVKRVGIEAKIVKIHGPRHHLSLGSFKTQQEAEAKLLQLQKKLNGQGFYVQQIVNTQQ